MQTTQPMTLADAVFPRIDSNSRAMAFARDLALMIGLAAFIALLAQVQIRTPWSTVPITLQTFGVLVAGGSLGAMRGMGSMSIYAVMGMIGIPVFTPAGSATTGAWDIHTILPWKGNEYLLWDASNGGYIVGFILAAGVVGFLAEHKWDRGARSQLAMLIGSVIVYVPGLIWLNHLIVTDWTPPGASKTLAELIAGTSDLNKTLVGGLYPFIVGDLMKLMAASMVLPAAWALVERFRGNREES